MKKALYWGLSAYWLVTFIVMLFPMGMDPAMFMMVIGMFVHTLVCAISKKCN